MFETKPLTKLLADYRAGRMVLDLDPMYTVDAIAQMAEDEGMDTWITCRGDWAIESKEIGASFILRELRGVCVEINVAEDDELNG